MVYLTVIKKSNSVFVGQVLDFEIEKKAFKLMLRMFGESGSLILPAKKEILKKYRTSMIIPKEEIEAILINDEE